MHKRCPLRHEEPNNHYFRSISRDPEVYPEPDEFRPDRWIDDLGRPRDDLKNKYFTFGFGRRYAPLSGYSCFSLTVPCLAYAPLSMSRAGT